MERFMNLIKKEKNLKYIIWIGFALGIFCMHLPMEYFNDDLSFLSSIENMSLLRFFILQFHSNGKILTDVLANLFLRLPMSIWKIFDTVVYLGIARLITCIFTKDTWKDILFVCVLIGLFPFWYLSTAGWVATTANYLYPMLCLLIVVYYFKKICLKNTISCHECLLMFGSIIYATNQDQSAMILIGGLFLYLCYYVMQKSDPKFIGWIAAILLFAMICYIIMFMLPGHINRMSSMAEMERWLPQYAEWSFLKKIYHGYTSTVAVLFFHDVKLFDLFCFLIFLLAWCQTELLKRIIGSIPFSSMVGIRLIGADKFVIYPSYAGGMPELIPLNEGWFSIAVFFWTLVVVISIFLTVCICVKNFENKWLLLMLLILASGSRMMMGFSATIYASHARTFTYFIYALILCNIVVLNEIKERKPYGWTLGFIISFIMLFFVQSPLWLQVQIL